MQVGTVKLKHKKKGRVITVDMADYATDLGKYKYAAYTLVGEQRGKDDASNPHVIKVDQDSDSDANSFGVTATDNSSDVSVSSDTVAESAKAESEESDDGAESVIGTFLGNSRNKDKDES